MARLLAPIILLILTACSPEERFAALLAQHPALFQSAAQVKDSIVTTRHDTAVTVAGRVFRFPLRTVYHFQHQERTLVLDNARSRRLLAQARSETGIARAELEASKRENGKLVGLAYPSWYQITWFWVALVLALLLLISIAARFYTFTPLSLFR